MNPEDLLLAALRREAAAWPERAPDGWEDALLAVASGHGVVPLLATMPAARVWPERVRTALAGGLRSEAALEAVRRLELCRILEAFSAAGLSPLLLKGAHLAYAHYPQPWLRPRIDTDLLIERDVRPQADRILRELGYGLRTHFSGELVTHQLQYERRNRYGQTELLDLHWKVSNPQVFASALSGGELAAEAAPVAVLGPGARGPSARHALLLACMHRVAHHAGADRLIWIYDIHLLSESMRPEAREAFLEMARGKGLVSVCAAGLAEARSRFGTCMPAGWSDASAAGPREPTAAFLRAGRTRIRTLRSDLEALPGWRPRLRLLTEHLFPPRAYIRHAYGITSPLLLPFAYAHRMVAGLRNWIRRE